MKKSRTYLEELSKVALNFASAREKYCDVVKVFPEDHPKYKQVRAALEVSSLKFEATITKLAKRMDSWRRRIKELERYVESYRDAIS